MRIAVAGGKNKADFLIDSLLGKKHTLQVINDDLSYCNYLAQTHKIPVFHGDPGKIYTLKDAGIEGYDIIIALTPFDSDNLAICQAGKRLLNIKKTVASVSNPKNVDVFKQLGVNTAISATYMLANIIEQASTIDSLLNTISVEHDKLILTEILLDQDSVFGYRQLLEVPLPERSLVGCVLRGDEILKADSQLLLLPNDKLLILSPPGLQDEIIASVIVGGAHK